MLPNQFYIRRNLLDNGDGLKYFPPKPLADGVKTYDYVMQVGETLMQIAQRIFGVSDQRWTLLAELNPGKRIDEWKAGDNIKMPEIISLVNPPTFADRITGKSKPKFVEQQILLSPVVVRVCAVPGINVVATGKDFAMFTLSNATGTVVYWQYQYRKLGDPTWIGPITTFSPAITLNNLETNAAEYEIQARAYCTYGAVSGWSGSFVFNTTLELACTVPTFQVFDVQSNSFKVQVNAGSADDVANTVQFQFEYKKVTDADWTVIQVGAGVTQITGLTPNTDYTTRLERECQGGVVSGYAAEQPITTAGICEVIHGLQVTEETTDSITYGWVPGYGNKRWATTLNEIGGLWSASKLVDVPSVQYTGLTAGKNYRLTVVPDCSDCEPSDPTYMIGGVQPETAWDGAVMKLPNELILVDAEVLDVNGNTINGVYDGKLLNGSFKKNDFQYMLQDDWGSFTSKSSTVVEDLLIPVDFFTVYNGVQKDLTKVKRGINSKNIPGDAPNNVPYAGAFQFPANHVTVGTVSPIGVQNANAHINKMSLVFQVRFVNLDVTANPQEAEWRSVVMPDLATFDTWCVNFANAISLYLADLGAVVPNKIVVRGLGKFLRDQTLAIRQRALSLLQNVVTIANGVPVMYLGAWDEWKLQYCTALSGFAYPLDEVWSIVDIISFEFNPTVSFAPVSTPGDFDNAMVTGEGAQGILNYPDITPTFNRLVTNTNRNFKNGLGITPYTYIEDKLVAEHLKRQHWLFNGGTGLAVSSAVLNDNGTLAVPTFSPNKAGFIHGTGSYRQSVGTVFYGSRDDVQAADVGWVETNGANYVRTQIPLKTNLLQSFDVIIRFKWSGATVVNGTIINLNNFGRLKFSDNAGHVQWVQGGFMIDFGVMAADTYVSIRLKFAFDGTNYGVIGTVGGVPPNLGSTLVGGPLGLSTYLYIGSDDAVNTNAQALKVSYLRVIATETSDEVFGGEFLFRDQIYGIRTEWSAVKAKPKTLIVGYPSLQGGQVEPGAPVKTTYNIGTGTTFYPSPLVNENIKPYFDRLRDFNWFLTNISGPYGSTFNIDEDEQKFNVINTVRWLKDNATVNTVLIDYIDARSSKTLRIVSGGKLYYSDAPDVILGKAVNGKKMIGYGGTIQDKFMP